MAKIVRVEIPRSTILELSGDLSFASKLYDAILEAENTGSAVDVSIGKARRKAQVSIVEE